MARRSASKAAIASRAGPHAFLPDPQVAHVGRKFISRSVLRAFLTYANWSEGLRGLLGGVPYQNRTSGLTYGVQAEIWFQAHSAGPLSAP
jgi:hypothetical protein